METQNMARVGYGLTSVVERMKDREFTVNGWKSYTVLSTLAMIRGIPIDPDAAKGKGKGKTDPRKRALADKVFGKGEATSKNFDNAWTMAKGLYSAGILDEKRKEITVMGIDDAFKATLAELEGHMQRLEVGGKEGYEGLCQYYDKAAIPVAEPEPEQPAAADEPEPDVSPAGETKQPEPEGETIEGEFSVQLNVPAVCEALATASDDDLKAVRAFIDATLAARQQQLKLAA